MITYPLQSCVSLVYYCREECYGQPTWCQFWCSVCDITGTDVLFACTSANNELFNSVRARKHLL